MLDNGMCQPRWIASEYWDEENFKKFLEQRERFYNELAASIPTMEEYTLWTKQEKEKQK